MFKHAYTYMLGSFQDWNLRMWVAGIYERQHKSREEEREHLLSICRGQSLYLMETISPDLHTKSSWSAET